MAHDNQPTYSTAALATGFGVGLIWIVMAITALWSSVRGYLNQRDDWGLAWGLIGVLLLAAGVAAIVATWWHETRVKQHG